MKTSIYSRYLSKESNVELQLSCSLLGSVVTGKGLNIQYRNWEDVYLTQWIYIAVGSAKWDVRENNEKIIAALMFLQVTLGDSIFFCCDLHGNTVVPSHFALLVSVSAQTCRRQLFAVSARTLDCWRKNALDFKLVHQKGARSAFSGSHKRQHVYSKCSKLAS